LGASGLQISDGENGFLVNSVEEAAKRIIQLLTDVQLRKRLGSRARQTVCEKFLMSRLLEDWIELLGGVQAGRR
jgi:trehalose synthase